MIFWHRCVKYRSDPSTSAVETAFAQDDQVEGLSYGLTPKKREFSIEVNGSRLLPLQVFILFTGTITPDG